MRCLAWRCFGAFLPITALKSHAATVLDQSFTITDGTNVTFSGGASAGFRSAETFTVGIAGTLSHVNIFTSGLADGVDIFTGFNILSATGGVPTTSVVGTGTFQSQHSGIASFTTSLAVTVGEVLAIEPTILPGSTAIFQGWRVDTGTTPPYARGADFVVNPFVGINDFTNSCTVGGADAVCIADNFQTFVTTPSTTPLSRCTLTVRHRPRRIRSARLAQEAEVAVRTEICLLASASRRGFFV
jgi:hypothetical protein